MTFWWGEARNVHHVRRTFTTGVYSTPPWRQARRRSRKRSPRRAPARFRGTADRHRRRAVMGGCFTRCVTRVRATGQTQLPVSIVIPSNYEMRTS